MGFTFTFTMARKKAPSKKRSREPKSSSSKEPPAKKGKTEEPAVEYKTVPCKKYWTIGHCELGPRCFYIHQEVSDAMAKQIVANNGELPSFATLSVPIKKSNPGVDGDVLSGAKAGRRHAGFSSAAASKQARGTGSGEQARGAGAEYDGYTGVGCSCKKW